jgi:hypothetical protein
MKEDVSLFYHVSASEAFTDQARIARLLGELGQHGYLLVASEERLAVWMAWMFYRDPDWRREDVAARAVLQAQAAPYQERIFTTGATELLRRQVEQFGKGQSNSLAVSATSVARSGPLQGLEFDLDLAPGDGYLALNYTNDFWTIKRRVQDSVAAFDHFLAIVEMLYGLVHPIYAYAWNHSGSIPVTDCASLERRTPSTLYEINLLGPEMVENLGGREHLLKTPAQIVRALSDGGVLIIPEAPWYPGSLPYSWSRAARYLGVICPDFAAGDADDAEAIL